MRRFAQASHAVRPSSESVRGVQRWQARPVLATVLRGAAYCGPVALSVGVVYAASRFAPPPSGSLARYVVWWAALSGGATVVLALTGRLSRRLLPSRR